MFFKMCVNFQKKINFFLNISKISQKLYNYANFKTGKPLRFKTKYGGYFTVTMIVGDVFGAQLMRNVKDIFRFAKVPVDFEEVHFDSKNNNADNVYEIITSIRRNGVAIKGNIYTENYDLNIPSPNVILRKELNLFANVLHCESQPGIRTKHDNIDLILIRQNTEGEYSCLEHESIPGVVQGLKIVTKERTEEIARFAFEYATQKNRKQITVVHKASVMPLSDGLFLEVCDMVAKEYPNIELDIMFMDTCCSILVTKPQTFDVFLLPNLYGNVLNNIACGLVGGAGVISGQNFGHDCAVFEIGSRSSVTLDNPLAMIKASVDLLHYLGLVTHARIIENAKNRTLNIDGISTSDVGGSADSLDVVNHIIQIIQEISEIK